MVLSEDAIFGKSASWSARAIGSVALWMKSRESTAQNQSP
jgi:hypothetical protein